MARSRSSFLQELERCAGQNPGRAIVSRASHAYCRGRGWFYAIAEADRLRRAMATFRKTGMIHEFGPAAWSMAWWRAAMSAILPSVAFKQIEGFGEYGFPESHAASFALLVYVSAWLKHHYPAAFCAAFINSQPMGFYAPAQLVGEARRQGGRALPVCINASDAEADLEINSDAQGLARVDLRLGFNQITGLPRPMPRRLWRRRQMGVLLIVSPIAPACGLGVGDFGAFGAG
jgi:error-prone DNA polymerase